MKLLVSQDSLLHKTQLMIFRQSKLQGLHLKLLPLTRWDQASFNGRATHQVSSFDETVQALGWLETPVVHNSHWIAAIPKHPIVPYYRPS
eukprot:Skav206121  [mRNA]  locus=scaffold172:196325:196594:- [translate_table: standard]